VTLIVSKGPQPYPVPDVTGKNLTEAKNILAAAGFEAQYPVWGDLPGFSDAAKVQAQDPSAQAMAIKGTKITLTIQLTG
jgi:serine/threonine-protein kinase